MLTPVTDNVRTCTVGIYLLYTWRGYCVSAVCYQSDFLLPHYTTACVPPPPSPSLCCTASVLRELCTFPEESPVSVHYLISGGTDCGDSLIHIHVQYKHDWSSVEHWMGRRGGAEGRSTVQYSTHTQCSRLQAFWYKNGVCMKEQNTFW